MEDMELLECLINTEIEKLTFEKGIVDKQGKTSRKEALEHEIIGMERVLTFIKEIQDEEEISD